eukprot:gnl/MRDRNA2_/MRDRNA2_70704_c0_seq1.p1 gnl/MRDRNA2_/MRDRNA2_70704_c0~~gnl/MRDRNA2_/MRDRNA2_70704_c0_seq1.p1  ORF type:complete len:940 (-),score=174.31 gnl/MRDRNA2_/MRDRNA2_70704_c0_seq1:222-3041(-)
MHQTGNHHAWSGSLNNWRRTNWLSTLVLSLAFSFAASSSAGVKSFSGTSARRASQSPSFRISSRIPASNGVHKLGYSNSFCAPSFGQRPYIVLQRLNAHSESAVEEQTKPQTVIKNNHPPWEYDFSNAEGFSGLHLYNSLTDEKEPFYPISGRTVKLYICGPTTYDSSHMGHARAYLTFDIVRRVLEDHFGYDVIAQTCITDIDDKIILQSRRNKLLTDYVKANHPMDAIKEKVGASVAARRSKLEAQGAELQVPAKNKREEAEREKLQKEQELKMSQFEETVQKIEAAQNSNELIEAGTDVLADLLDKELGHTVQMQEVATAHARRYEEEFFEDMAALGVREPDMVARVTEHVPDIVDFVKVIVDKGLAYESSGSVYFDTTAFKCTHEYPKLVPSAGSATQAEIAEGEGALADFRDDKRHPNDFALWKNSKPGEPKWPSPWGEGRPGWHIECSAMASKILGDRLDIHCGGADLKFPHHDNEMAQSEAYHDCQQWVNYFMHAGHLSIKGLKMSKSLKNFITIQQALEVHTGRQLRIMFLTQHWDRPMEYSDQTMDAAKEFERKLVSFFGNVRAILRNSWVRGSQDWGDEEVGLDRRFQDMCRKVHASLSDNINTPAVMFTLSDMMSDATQYMLACEAMQRPVRVLLIRKISSYLTSKLKMLGVISGMDDVGFAEGGSQGSIEQVLTPTLDAFAGFRDEVRQLTLNTEVQKLKGPLLHACDKCRDETMVDLGVRLEDRASNASVWKLEDAETLRRELQAAKAQQLEREIEKVTKRLDNKKRELDKWLDANVPPEKLFIEGKTGKRFTKFDESGFPTHGEDGEELTKSARKTCVKDLKKHTRSWDQLKAKEASDPEFLVKQQIEVESLEKGLHSLQQQKALPVASGSNLAAVAVHVTLLKYVSQGLLPVGLLCIFALTGIFKKLCSSHKQSWGLQTPLMES